MRTGAIFARGSCRALAWVLALGVVAVLSGGEAAAQAPVLSKGTLTLDEGESDSSIRLTIDDDSAATVTVSVDSIEGGVFDLVALGTATVINATTVTRDIAVPENGSVRLTVTANDDNDSEDARAVLIFTIGSETATLILRSTDDDTSGVIVSERSLTLHEGGEVETYTIKLGTSPSSPVTVTAAVTRQLNARIRVRTVDDDAATTDADESEFGMSRAFVFVADGETPGTGETLWNVAQTVAVRAEGDANTRNGSARITNKASSTDGDYSGVSGRNVEITEYDNVRTITMSTSSDTAVEGGDKVTITATLSAAGDTPSTLPVPITVKLTKDGTKPPGSDYDLETLIIGANSTSGSADLMAEHDADADDEKLTLIASVDADGTDGVFTEIVNEKFSITLEDDDTYTLEADKSEVAEGGEVTLTVKVDPKAAVETKVSIDLYRASGATVAPAENQDADEDGNAIIDIGGSSAKFTLKTAKDPDDTMDEVIVVRAMVGSSVVGESVSIDVLDTENAPVYTLDLDPDSIGEADGEQSVMLKVMTNKAVKADTTLTLAVDATASTAMDPADYSIMPAEMSVMVAKGEKMGMTTLTVTPVADSMDESNEKIVLTAWMDDAQVGNSVELMIIDGDSPGSGITPKTGDEVAKVFSDAIEMAGGLMVGGNMVKVDMSMLFNMANPDMEVMYSASSSDESVLGASPSDSMLTLDPMMEGMSTVSVEAKPAGMGSPSGAVSAFTCTGACVSVNLDVEAATSYAVAASAETVMEGGEAVTITATASRAVAENTEVMLMRDGASTAGMDDYSLDPPLITIMMGETSGTLMLMATDDSEVEGMESLTLNAMVGDMGAGMVTVSIEDNDMETTFTLSGPEDMNIAEGMSATLTATASQAVMADTEIMIMRDGSSSAGMDDFTVEAITIMAGETTGTTEVMAVEDGMAEDMEMLTLYGMVDGLQTNSVSFNLWDAAVPALPVIAQLLLAAFLALGGYRRYLRR